MACENDQDCEMKQPTFSFNPLRFSYDKLAPK